MEVPLQRRGVHRARIVVRQRKETILSIQFTCNVAAVVNGSEAAPTSVARTCVQAWLTSEACGLVGAPELPSYCRTAVVNCYERRTSGMDKEQRVAAA